MENTENFQKRPVIRSWHLENFKSIKTADVEFAPLTVIVGMNSSGKSSLIQSILLMAQNARTSLLNRELSNRSLDLNGALVGLGTFQEIVNEKAGGKYQMHKKIEIGGCIGIEEEERRVIFGRGSKLPRPSGDFKYKQENQELAWNIVLNTLGRDKTTGLANVKESSATYQVNGKRIEKISSKEEWNDEHPDLPKYPQFNFKASGKLKTSEMYEDSDDYITSADGLEFKAVAFKMGIPFSGLVSVPRGEYFLNIQKKLWEEELSRHVIRRIQRRPMFPSKPSSLERERDSARKAMAEFRNLSINELDSKLSEFQESYVSQVKNIFDQKQNEDFSLWEQMMSDPRFLVQFNDIPFFVTDVEANEDGAELFPVLIDDVLEHFDMDDVAIRESVFSRLNSQATEFWTEIESKISLYLRNLSVAQEETLVPPDRGERISKTRRSVDDEPFKVSWAVDEFQKVLLGVTYLGPLREKPRHLYDRDLQVTTPALPLGKMGELIARRIFDNDVREYPLPGGTTSKIKDNIGLKDALNLWLKHLGLSTGDGVEVKVESFYGYRLTVDGRGLPAMGTGVSQVLPVIALCLMIPKGGIAMFEEPELHLNPGIQQKLADFLLEISKTGRQIIAETHSEYIVTRLRRRAAEAPENQKAFTFVFTEIDDESGTKYTNVSPESNGLISEWPKGFFDQVSGDVRALLLKAAEINNIS